MIQNEIFLACRRLMDAMDKPREDWKVLVTRAPSQLNVYMVVIDRIVRDSGEVTMYSRKCAVCHEEWEKWSVSEREIHLRRRMTEAIEELESADADVRIHEGKRGSGPFDVVVRRVRQASEEWQDHAG